MAESASHASHASHARNDAEKSVTDSNSTPSQTPESASQNPQDAGIPAHTRFRRYTHVHLDHAPDR